MDYGSWSLHFLLVLFHEKPVFFFHLTTVCLFISHVPKVSPGIVSLERLSGVLWYISLPLLVLHSFPSKLNMSKILIYMLYLMNAEICLC